MTHEEFFSAMKRNDIAPVYLFQGDEAFIQDKALALLRKKLLPDGLEAMNETVLVNPAADAVIGAAETLPMLGERRLVLIRDSMLLLPGKSANEAEEAKKLSEYLDHAPDTTCILFLCRVLPDGRKKLTQTLNQKACVIKFDKLSDHDLVRWIRQQMKQYGKIMTEENALFLSFWAGRELLTLSQEIAKMAAYLGERQEAEKSDIERVATQSLECTIFQLVDALVEGSEADSFKLLTSMLENGEARIGILAMLARQYRNLYYFKQMQEIRMPEAEIGKRLGLPSFAVRKLSAQAKNMETQSLRAKLDLCVDTDFAIKSGKMREDAALERVIFMNNMATVPK